MLGLLRSTAALVVLVFASFQDYSRREVDDWLWVVGVSACLGMDLVDLYLGEMNWIFFVASLGVAFLLALSLSLVGVYGGADGKALLLVSTALPSYPLSSSTLLTRIFPIPLLFVFVVSTLLSGLVPLSILILNIRDAARGRKPLRGFERLSWLRKLVLYLMVRRVGLERLRGSLKYFPAEKIVATDNGVLRKPVFFIHAEADVDKLYENLEAFKGLLEDGVLATPTIPMIVFFAASFLLTNLLLLTGI